MPSTKSKPKSAKSTKPSASATPLSWTEFAALDGSDGRALTPELLVAQLVGTSVFPELPTEHEGFGGNVDVEPMPASHEMFPVTNGDAEYRVFYKAARADENYKDHAKATFKALADAIAAVHGKAADTSAKHRAWELADREIWLNLYFQNSDPYGADVRLRVKPKA